MIINIVIKLLNLYSLLILMRAIYSWINPSQGQGQSRIYYYLCLLTDPVLNKFRFVSGWLNLPVDLSPIIVIFIISFLKRALINYV